MGEINEIATKLEQGKCLEEFETQDIQFFDEGKLILCPIDIVKGQTIGGKLLALYNLSINKKAANLFFDSIKPITLIVKHAKELEKRIALRLVTQLCFYGNQASHFLFEQCLYDEIKLLSSKKFTVKSLQKTIEHVEYAYELLNRHGCKDAIKALMQSNKFKKVCYCQSFYLLFTYLLKMHDLKNI